MKKQLIFMVAALGLLTACDPSKDSIGMPGNSSLTGEQLASGFTVTQYSDEAFTTEAADGNYFKFTTSPSRVVTVYQLDAEGTRNDLVAGKPNGTFKIVPKRGNPTSQTYYVETRDFNGNTIVATKTANVYVPQELEPVVRILASDAFGSKTWKWDTEFREDGAVWGNCGYAAGDDWSSGIWWGAKPEDLAGQLAHSDTGVATGEESADATMIIYDDGSLACFDAGGNQIRKGKYSVEGWTGEKNQASIDGSQAAWAYGTLKTTEGSILFPFKINGGGTKPTAFEIMQLDASHLKLIYAAPGTGGWGEATWWAFKSTSDCEGALTDFGTKAWTWDTEFREDGAVWGNCGYAAGDDWSSGIWWGAKPEDLAGQLAHSDTGVATGEESADAYMTFDWKTGAVKSYSGSGAEIRSGKFEIPVWFNGEKGQASVDGSQTAWAYGTLHTDAGSILFPFKINGGGTKPTDFEIMQLDSDHMKLIYAAPGTGGWGEATWWAFKKK
ncbi:MAG: hypothetical protein K5764_07045 [Prevotella sp.]|nr:hypothetical protein [Prevotella sp.]